MALVLTIGGNAQAQDQCGCSRIVTNSGVYRVEFPEKVNQPSVGSADIVVEDSGDVVAAAIIGTAGGGGMSLTCQPDGTFAGVMQPRNQPSIVSAVEGVRSEAEPSKVDGDVPFGLRLAGEFDVVVERPPEAGGAANEVMVPTLRFLREEGLGNAPEKFCERVSNTIQSVHRLLDAYANPILLDAAVLNELPGLQEGSHTMLNFDGTGGYRTRGERVTYDELVSVLVTKRDPSSTDISYDQLYAEAAALGDDGPTSVTVVASTDPGTCRITPPSERDSRGLCRLGIEIDAAMAHEWVHSERCDNVKEETVDPTGYQIWGNHPINHSNDEIAAYIEELTILEPWYETHCGE